MIIDATDLILGRLASYAAKKALLGEKIDIINSEKSVISGKKERIFGDYLRKRQRGIPLQGPYIPRMADMLVRRTIRGMMPYKTDRGKKAFSNVVKSANLSKLPYLKYKTVEYVCQLMRSK